MALPPLPDSDSANALRSRSPALATHPLDPTGLTCPSLGRKGGAWRVAAGTRGLGGCRYPPLLITPPRQSSSASGVPPTTPAKASVQPRHPARYISPLRYCEAAAPLPRRGGGQGGQDIPPRSRAGGGGPGRGTVGPSSLAPNRFLPGHLGPTGWLLGANVIWGRLGGTPPIKNRFWMDNCSSQSGAGEGAGSDSAWPLSFASSPGGGAPAKRSARSDGSPRLPRGSQRPSAGCPRFPLQAPCHLRRARPAALGPSLAL